LRGLIDRHVNQDGGCKKVVVSAACKDGILNVVYGCNHDKYDPAMDVVTAASCTTNCIAPVIKVRPTMVPTRWLLAA
jgi:glyceraldehyde-3-phosphate dehydrogenase/erythrose-4-phosphate dehydrogenase